MICAVQTRLGPLQPTAGGAPISSCYPEDSLQPTDSPLLTLNQWLHHGLHPLRNIRMTHEYYPHNSNEKSMPP